MNGRDERQERRARRRSRSDSFNRELNSKKGRLCMNGCGKPGPHYVPPSFGEPGFYSCTTKEEK